MISTLFSNPISFLVFAGVLLLTIAVHEFAHAKIADHLGDPTARLAGRLTLNPFAHLDIYGLIFLLFVGFGWGKPVPFDPFNLKNPRKDAALISLAGPTSNFIMAILGSVLFRLIILVEQSFLGSIGLFILLPFIQINVALGLFNLVPMAPLDGFKIVGGILPEEKAREWYGLERYGIIFLFFLFCL